MTKTTFRSAVPRCDARAACLLAAGAAFAVDREHQQIKADIRMLQEQAQQLQALADRPGRRAESRELAPRRSNRARAQGVRRRQSADGQPLRRHPHRPREGGRDQRAPVVALAGNGSAAHVAATARRCGRARRPPTATPHALAPRRRCDGTAAGAGKLQNGCGSDVRRLHGGQLPSGDAGIRGVPELLSQGRSWPPRLSSYIGESYFNAGKVGPMRRPPTIA